MCPICSKHWVKVFVGHPLANVSKITENGQGQFKAGVLNKPVICNILIDFFYVITLFNRILIFGIIIESRIIRPV